MVFCFFVFLISNEKILLKYQKKYHPSIQEVYTRDKKQSRTQITSIHQRKTEKNRMTACYRQPIQQVFEEEEFKIRSFQNLQNSGYTRPWSVQPCERKSH